MIYIVCNIHFTFVCIYCAILPYSDIIGVLHVMNLCLTPFYIMPVTYITFIIVNQQW